MSSVITEFSEAIAAPLDTISTQFKALANEHSTANTTMLKKSHDLTTSFQGLGGTEFIKMVDKQYKYTDGIVQAIDQIAGFISTAVGWIRSAAHFANMLIQPFVDLVEKVIHRLSPDLVIREGEDAVHAIIRDMENTLQDMASTGGSFFSDAFHLNFGGAWHDLEREGKDVERLTGDTLALLGQVENILAHWAAKIFEAVNWCFNQINGVVYHLLDWVFGFSDMMGDEAILNDPNATPEEKAIAGTMMGLTVLMDVAMFIPGVDIFAMGAKFAGKGLVRLAEKFGVDELVKMLTTKMAARVADSVVKDVVEGVINATKDRIARTAETLAEKGLLSTTLTDDEVLNKVGHLFNGGAKTSFDALSPEGKKFVENYAQYVKEVTEFEHPSLQNMTADQRAKIFQEEQKVWAANLTKDEKEAMLDYTGDMYYSINNSLRKDAVPSYLNDTIKNLDTALQGAVIPKDTIAQRVVGDDMLHLFEEGKPFVDKGYMSTSIKPEHNWQNSLRLFVELPEGSPGAFVKDLSSVPNEYEVLLPRGSVMDVEQVINLKDLKEALSPADQKLLFGFPDYVIRLLYTSVPK